MISRIHLQVERGHFCSSGPATFEMRSLTPETACSQRLRHPVIVCCSALTWTWHGIRGKMRESKNKEVSERVCSCRLNLSMWKNVNLVGRELHIEGMWMLSTYADYGLIHTVARSGPAPQHLRAPAPLPAHTKPGDPRGVESTAPPTKTARL